MINNNSFIHFFNYNLICQLTNDNYKSILIDFYYRHCNSMLDSYKSTLIITLDFRIIKWMIIKYILCQIRM